MSFFFSYSYKMFIILFSEFTFLNKYLQINLRVILSIIIILIVDNTNAALFI